LQLIAFYSFIMQFRIPGQAGGDNAPVGLIHGLALATAPDLDHVLLAAVGTTNRALAFAAVLHSLFLAGRTL
jgi:hypothetical protein